jgi:hypothetical protein
VHAVRRARRVGLERREQHVEVVALPAGRRDELEGLAQSLVGAELPTST